MIVDRPTVAEVVPLARAIFKTRSITGCCLHLVLDDGNVKDEHVLQCITVAIDRGHIDCLYVANKLALMTRSQRARVGQRV